MVVRLETESTGRSGKWLYSGDVFVVKSTGLAGGFGYKVKKRTQG